MLGYLNAGVSVITGSDEATKSQTESQASSTDTDESNIIEELEVEHDEQDKDKGSHTTDCNDSAFPLTFSMKQKIVLDVPADVVQ